MRRSQHGPLEVAQPTTLARADELAASWSEGHHSATHSHHSHAGGKHSSRHGSSHSDGGSSYSYTYSYSYASAATVSQVTPSLQPTSPRPTDSPSLQPTSPRPTIGSPPPSPVAPADDDKYNWGSPDDAVNCAGDDCDDLYPNQLDDNWVAVTDETNPHNHSGGHHNRSTSRGHGHGRHDRHDSAGALSYSYDTSLTTADAAPSHEPTPEPTPHPAPLPTYQPTPAVSEAVWGADDHWVIGNPDDAVNCAGDDCDDLYPNQLDDNWVAVTDETNPHNASVNSSSSNSSSGGLNATGAWGASVEPTIAPPPPHHPPHPSPAPTTPGDTPFPTAYMPTYVPTIAPTTPVPTAYAPTYVPSIAPPPPHHPGHPTTGPTAPCGTPFPTAYAPTYAPTTVTRPACATSADCSEGFRCDSSAACVSRPPPSFSCCTC